MGPGGVGVTSATRRRQGTAIDLVRLRDLFCENRTRWFSTAELADRFEVTQRTAQRWLGLMDDLGVPLETNRADGGMNGYGVRYRVMQR